MTQTELLKMIGSGAVRDLDLTGRELKNIDFKGCRVENVTFDECTLTECNFDGCGMERVSFRKAVLRNCRFRRAKIAWSDFRYCEIERATFEEAEIRFCDLYRAMLTGIVIMRKARIGETSLYYAYFGEGVNIRRENIAGGRLLQQDLDAYRQFLIEWNTSGTGVRRNDRAEQSAWSPDAALHAGGHAQRRPDDDRHPAHGHLRLHPRQQDTQSVKAVFTLRQYLTTLADTHGLTRTLGEIEVCRDGKGRICYSAGNSAVVFRIRCEGRVRSLRCYMHHPRHLAEIYGEKLLPQELFIYTSPAGGVWVDVVLSDWIEGVTLHEAVAAAAETGDTARLRRFAAAFDRMAAALTADDWAHGDLKPENIVADNRGRLHLIDFDAMFLPAFAGRHSPELGTAAFQHPARTVRDFDASLDDYPAALISTALHALALDPTLYARYSEADGLLFTPQKIGTDAALCEVLALFERRGLAAQYRIARLLRSPSLRLPGLPQLLALAAETTETDERTGPEETKNAVNTATTGTTGSGETAGSTGPKRAMGAEETAGGNSGSADGPTGAPADGSAEAPAGDSAESTTGAPTEDPTDGAVAEAAELFVENGLWGYRTPEQVVVPPLYDCGFDFTEGLAAVRLGATWHYIDGAGRTRISCPGCEAVKPFRNGRAPVVRGGRRLEIDREGREFDI
ncbi:pentapeptide repeat-containing protein [Alistipes finegoldii]|uniref:pentapeptide repeat-containing protein n=2 Tax=Alistipes finegoldii TaxID=214856 RepID=UPI001D06EADD|nr:pentapeptide repeat-containing protein [Alistipes finegoldii]MCB6682431.1 pentapeptide repeat-containing protein [Alistipes finegoldii]